METAVKSGLRVKAWGTSLKNLAFGIGALGTVAFATPVHAVATFDALARVQVTATVFDAAGAIVADPTGLVFAEAGGVQLDVNTFVTGAASASANSNAPLPPPNPADPIPVSSIIGQTFDLTASVLGSAGTGGLFGQAIANSLNSFIVAFGNLTIDQVFTIQLDWTIIQSVFASTEAQAGDTASALSDILITDSAGVLGSIFDLILFAGSDANVDTTAVTNDPADLLGGIPPNMGELIEFNISQSFILDPLLQGGFEGAVLLGLPNASGRAISGNPVPEPAGLALLLAGLAGLSFARRRSLKF